MLLDSLKNRRGFTLVEMMVSLALIAILLIGAMRLISVNLAVYNKNKAHSEAEVVADYLLAYIERDISGATAGSKDTKRSIYLYRDPSTEEDSIFYYDSNGVKSRIFEEEGKLKFYQYNTGHVSESGEIDSSRYLEPGEKIKIPSENYKGYEVKKMTTSTIDHYRNESSIVTVTLELYKSTFDIEYKKSITIENFNGAAVKGPSEDRGEF